MTKDLQKAIENRDKTLESYLSTEAQCSLKYKNGGKLSEEELMNLIDEMAAVNESAKEVDSSMRQEGLVPAGDTESAKESAKTGWHNQLRSI